MGGNLSAEISHETLVTAAKFLRNACNRRYFLRITGGLATFLPPIRRYGKFSAKIWTWDMKMKQLQTTQK